MLIVWSILALLLLTNNPLIDNSKKDNTFNIVKAELYTSVDEISRWPEVSGKVSDVLEDFIRSEELKLNKMRQMHDTITGVLNDNIDMIKQKIISFSEQNSSDQHLETMTTKMILERQLQNPIKAFVTVNSIVRAIKGLKEILGDCSDEEDGSATCSLGEQNTKELAQDMIEKLQGYLPLDDDLTGSGEALLRLQLFYDLEIDDMINGIIRWPAQSTSSINDENKENLNHGNLREKLVNVPAQPLMKAEDCFELGKIAFRDEQYSIAIQWLYKALEMCTKTGDENSLMDSPEEKEVVINEILEHMAFSAFKLNHMKYAAQLTQVWLERDLENDRARGNMEYYAAELEELEGTTDQEGGEERLEELNHDTDKITGNLIKGAKDILLSKTAAIDDEQTNIEDYQNYSPSNSDSYSLTNDTIVRDLCRRQNQLFMKHGLCTFDNQMGIKMEILNEDPKIIRLLDIVSEEECQRLKELASTQLSRSTINSRDGGHQTSDFRIAKTAWLSSEEHQVVRKIEERLSAILNIRMDGAEHLQVVNYGLGGFYGPHVDSSRATTTASSRSHVVTSSNEDIETHLEDYNELGTTTNDRYATILMYLNDVEAGGATVFPRLNLVVEPIERSAVVWFNHHVNGFSDERTLHTGCPVLLGSKWIATKWPREVANSFNGPCKRRRLFESIRTTTTTADAA